MSESVAQPALTQAIIIEECSRLGSRSALARAIGSVSHQAIAQWVDGRAQPKDKLLVRLLRSGDPQLRRLARRVALAKHGELLTALRLVRAADLPRAT